ncbi:MAG: thioredoxin family protein [Rhodospirillaceae bacterium]|nr:thioredoxin family protein [Rhodospirillaceae bacterium]
MMKPLALAALALTLAAPLFSGQAGAQTTAQTEEVQAELLADRTTVAPGGSVWLGLDLKIKQGWHTYWRTPGDSGQPTSIRWTLPEGVTAGEIQWPLPDRVEVLGIMNFGYHDHVMLLSELKVDPATAPSNAEIKADVTWLVCADVCIPQDASFSMPLKIDAAPAPITTPAAAAIQVVRDSLPQAAPFPVKAMRTGDQITFAAGPGVEGTVKDVTYFPTQDGLIVNAAAQTAKVKDGSFTVAVAAEKKSETITDAQGLLVVERTAPGGGTAKVGYYFDSPIVWTGPAASGETANMSFALALVFAFLGGIILNVMPCVLPVLVMKAMSFIKQSGVTAAERQKDALFYTAGVLAAFTALVGGLIALRAGGAAIGWGFQLQSPAFVVVIAYVMLLLGLNLSGVFVVGGNFGMGQSLASKPGATGSFFTGLLAVVVAAPCTGPFMGAAVGYALTQPTVMSFAIFEALALGLAFPYLLLAFVPAAGKLLPRPGVWMDRVKQVLAFPLYGAAAWLIWVLAQQVDPIGLAYAFAGVVAVGFAGWIYGISQQSESRGRHVGLGFAGLAMVAVIAIVFTLNDRAAAAPAAKAGAVAEGAPSEPFTAARLKELQTSGRPVLVNFTAAWCLTCIVNERVALSHAEVAEALKGRNVAYLKADWTNQNPEITATLHALGRDGVPLYVLYDGKGGAPKILPQLLTPAIVTDAIKAL